MNSELVKLFGCSTEERRANVSVKRCIKQGLERGYVIDPRVCNRYVEQFLLDIPIDYRSTFYKNVNDVTSKSRFELLIDQITHYSSTYGTDFTEGNGYVPNDSEESIIEFEKYKFISCVTPKEMFDRCTGLVQTNVALSSTTAEALTDFIVEFIKKDSNESKREYIEKVQVREVKTRLMSAFKIYVGTPIDILRYIVFVTTGETMIIQNKNLINKIKSSRTTFVFRNLTDEDLVKLSQIFLRFKNVFLAFKHNEYVNNRHYINKLRKLAVENHKPMKKSIWDNIFDDSVTVEDVRAHIGEISNFRKITIIQAINYNLNLQGKNLFKNYIIRNGKVFTKLYDKSFSRGNRQRLLNIALELMSSIADSIRDKACYVKYPDGIDIKAPTSEKSFIGDYPIGTSYELADHNMLGIYWRNEWGTRDFDLSICDAFLGKIGWNSDYYNAVKDIVYSGDMTNADPEASEIMYVKNKSGNNCMLKINRFRGNQGSKFRFFIAQQQDDSFKSEERSIPYNVDPNNIKLAVNLISEKKEQILGIIFDNSFWLVNNQTRNSQVSAHGSSQEVDSFKNKIKSFISLKSILELANFKDVSTLKSENEEDQKILDQIEKGEIEMLDLTNLNRDTLISIFK